MTQQITREEWDHEIVETITDAKRAFPGLDFSFDKAYGLPCMRIASRDGYIAAEISSDFDFVYGRFISGRCLNGDPFVVAKGIREYQQVFDALAFGMAALGDFTVARGSERIT
jgi:hypothetical protein